jgi:magnesium chelatase family protein
MNPCRCGKGKDDGCVCPPHIREAYHRRISVPVSDRIDLWVNVNKINYEKLAAARSTDEDSTTIRARVTAARSIQIQRFEKNSQKRDQNLKKNHGGEKYFNSEMSADDIEKCANLSDDARTILRLSAERFRLSGRAFHRVIKVARTIADLAGSESIAKEHVLEALQYRRKSV